MASQQPLLVTATARAPAMPEQQPLPPRSNGQTMPNSHPQVIPSQVEHPHSDSSNM